MEFFRKTPNIDFLGKRKLAIALSMFLNAATIVLLLTRGLNFGVDFTGGTLIEVQYADAVEVAAVRKALSDGGVENAAVQHYGTPREILIRLRVEEGKTTAQQSNRVMEALRAPVGERLVEEETRPGAVQRCVGTEGGQPAACKVQVKRVEFVGPQVGRELVDKGLLGILFALIGILIYVAFRFEWRFAVGAVIATLHDVLLTVGFFSVTWIEFSLVELAAVLTVMGYSINDTVVVFDRIRENFRKLRTEDVVHIMNTAVNETLSRTIMTGVSTLLVVGALLFYGGDSLFGFSAALISGILIGTYSSVFVASPSVLMLGLTRADMVQPKKETAADSTP
jgi:preprotein translocase subunit SecF